MSSSDPSGGIEGVATTITNAATDTVNAVSNVATTSANAVSEAATSTANAVSNAATSTANAATSMFNSVVKGATNAAKNVPFLNSIMPSANANRAANANRGANANANRPANVNANANRPANANANANRPANKAANNSAFNVFNTVGVNNSSPATNAANTGSHGSYGLYVFIGLILLFIIVFSVFNEQIKMGYQYVESNIRRFLNMSVPPDVISATVPPAPDFVTIPPEAPQDITPDEASLPQPTQRSIVEKVLPASGNEVFNVAQNKFTYYDAEPLCNALGAELATYEQVKDAWSAGADWCNYGWVKGQMAVYPTQKATHDKLQMGPADQRGACGTVGINGGFFDNPEFKYGVNCYGKKPSQSAHDQILLMSEGKAPKSPATLKVDELTAEFKEQADALFVRPFNDSKWQA